MKIFSLFVCLLAVAVVKQSSSQENSGPDDEYTPPVPIPEKEEDGPAPSSSTSYILKDFLFDVFTFYLPCRIPISMSDGRGKPCCGAERAAASANVLFYSQLKGKVTPSSVCRARRSRNSGKLQKLVGR
eukprot:GHVS01094346.1.p1 GENE.GHVS01094346.1~~GHVS01094346.1.p1  ORF type:complete len:129 (+),score=7.55 GHVS01094346.1:396-782(+)